MNKEEEFSYFEDEPNHPYTEEDLIKSFQDYLKIIDSDNINLQEIGDIKTRIWCLVNLLWTHCDPPDDEDILEAFKRGYFEPENLARLRKEDEEYHKGIEEQYDTHPVHIDRISSEELIKNCPF